MAVNLTYLRRNPKPFWVGFFCLLLIARFSGPAVYAQGTGAAMQGTVTDSTGAVVPGATVTASNTETNLQRTVQSSSRGFYLISNLPPGRYRVQVTSPGFQSSVRENIELVVAQQLTLNVIGPGLTEMDISLFKTTQISERLRMQFRAEVFNVINRTNFGIPGVVVLTPSGAPASSAGKVTRTATESRQIQFGMKLTW